MKQAVLITILVAATMLVGWSIMAHAYAPVSGLPLFVMPGWKMLGAMGCVFLLFVFPYVSGLIWFSSLKDGQQWYLLTGIGLSLFSFWATVKLQLPFQVFLIGLASGLLAVVASRMKLNKSLALFVQCSLVSLAILWSSQFVGRHLNLLPEEFGGQRPAYYIAENATSYETVVFDTGDIVYVQFSDINTTYLKSMPTSSLGVIGFKAKKLTVRPPIWRISDATS